MNAGRLVLVGDRLPPAVEWDVVMAPAVVHAYELVVQMTRDPPVIALTVAS